MGAGMAFAPIVGMMSDAINSNRQQKNNERSMNIQYENQRKLNEQGFQFGKDIWDYTNAENQAQHYRDAGLSVGMMYGGAGTSGATTSTPSGGGASGSGGAGMATGMAGSIGAMAQLGLMESQKENIDANTSKTQAETEKLAGVDTKNVEADTALKEYQAENQKILANVANQTQEEAIDTIKANYHKAEGEAATAVSQGKYSEEKAKAEVKKLQEEGTLTAIKVSAEKAGIALTEEQTRAISENLAQGWEQLHQANRSNNIQARKNGIELFKIQLNNAIDKANVDLRAKEVMIRGAEAFVNGLGNIKGKTTTTNTHTSTPKGEYYQSSKSTTK